MSYRSWHVRIRGIFKENYKDFIFLLLLLFSVGFLLFISVKTDVPNMAFDNEDVALIEGDWTVKSETMEQTLSFPIKVDAQKGETVSYSKVLEETALLTNSIMFRSSHQFARVYLDGELLLDYGRNQITPIKMTPCSAWQLVRLPNDWVGKTLTIELSSTYQPYSGMLNAVFIGTKSGLIYMIIHRVLGTIAVIVSLLLLGIVLLLSSLMFQEKRARKKLAYLGIISLFMGVWILLESQMSQLIFSKIPTALSMDFIVFSILPIVFISFALSYESFENSTYMKNGYWLSLFDFLLIQLLQITGIATYMESFYLAHLAFIYILAGVLIVLPLEKIVKKERVKDKDVYLASFVFGIFGLGDMLRMYIWGAGEKDVYLTKIGIICFVAILGYFGIKKAASDQASNIEKETLKKLAYTDILTGLSNRTVFEDELERNRRNRSKSDIIIMIADLNDLKTINDQFGHAAGDEAIRRTANTLQTIFGDYGNCFRIGGDEFCAILEGLSTDLMQQLSEKFMKEVTLTLPGMNYNVSVACGYAKATDAGIDEAFKKADNSMYDKKKRMKGKRA